MLEDPLFTSEVSQLKAAQVRGEVTKGRSRLRQTSFARLFLSSIHCPVFKKIVEVGDALPVSQNRSKIPDKDGLIKIIALGQILVTGRDYNGVVLVEEATAQIIKRFPKTV